MKTRIRTIKYQSHKKIEESQKNNTYFIFGENILRCTLADKRVNWKWTKTVDNEFKKSFKNRLYNFNIEIDSSHKVKCDSFGTRSKKMQISQRLFIRFWTCIYDYYIWTFPASPLVSTCFSRSKVCSHICMFKI
jgi:hypothetical protein